MKNDTEHLDSLIDHLDMVRRNCIKLGKALIQKGERECGYTLIAHGFTHDNSKFFGEERDYLHRGNDIPEDVLLSAIQCHRRNNPHHCEFHVDCVQNMSKMEIAEMLCDTLARAQETGTDWAQYLDNVILPKWGFSRSQLEFMDWARKVLKEEPFRPRLSVV